MAVEGIEVGATASFEKQITQEDIVAYAAISGDAHPLHVDSEYAAKTRFKAPIAHGMLGAGLISAALGFKLAPHAVVVYLGQTLRFRAPVSAGDTLTANVEATEVDDERSRITLNTVVTNQEGTEVITGEAQIMLDAIR